MIDLAYANPIPLAEKNASELSGWDTQTKITLVEASSIVPYM